MSLATLRKSLLKNVPNIPRFGVTIDVSGRSPTNCVIEYQGQSYSVAMFYVTHNECGKRIRGLFPRAAYNRMNSRESRDRARPLLIFCADCGAMAGKSVRRQLRNQGRPYSFHDSGMRDVPRDLVGAYYIFPRGVGYNPQGEITSVSREWTTPVDEDDVLEFPDYDED